MNLRFNRQSSNISNSNKTVSEPTPSGIGRSSNYMMAPVMTKNPTVHSYGSYGQSSNYITMQNIDSNMPSQSFHTIQPHKSHISTVFPLQIASNVIRQHISQAPVTHSRIVNTPTSLNYPQTQPFPTFHKSTNNSQPNIFTQNPNPKRPSSHYHHQNPVREQQQDQQNSYKHQYLQIKNSYQILNERHLTLKQDYQTLMLKYRLADNNQEYFVGNNQDLARKNSGLQAKLYQIQQELIAARMHNQSLNAQISNMNRGIVNFKTNTPTYETSPHLSDYYQPPLRQLQHENRQLLFRIQQYESTIIYKNSQLQKFKADLQAKEIEIHSLRREIQTFFKKQKLHNEQQKLFKKGQSELSIMPKLKQQISSLKSKITSLNQKNNELQSNNQKIKSLQSKIQQLQTTNNNYASQIKQLQDINTYQSRLQFTQQNIPHNFSKVLTTYIGDQNFQAPQQNINQSYNKTINQSLYKNLTNNTSKYPTQPSRDEYNVGYRFADNLSGKNAATHMNSINGNPLPVNIVGSKLADNLYNGNMLQMNRKSDDYNLQTPVEMKKGITRFVDTLKSNNYPNQQSKLSSQTNRSSKLRIQDQAFYDFGKQYAFTSSNEELQQIPQLTQTGFTNNKGMTIPYSSKQQSSFPETSKLQYQIARYYQNLQPKNRQNHKMNNPLSRGQSDFILEYPQLPFRQNSLIQHNNYMQNQQKLGACLLTDSNMKPLNLYDVNHEHHYHPRATSQKQKQRRHKIFKYDDNPSFDQVNQSNSLENLQKRIVQLAGENKSLRNFLTKKVNQKI